MSWQRAVVNCQRCYNQARLISERINRHDYANPNCKPYELKRQLNADPTINESRERAMIALEERLQTNKSSAPECSDGYKALIACSKCEFKCPEIAKYYDYWEEPKDTE